jgi:hypothetical protein
MAGPSQNRRGYDSWQPLDNAPQSAENGLQAGATTTYKHYDACCFAVSFQQTLRAITWILSCATRRDDRSNTSSSMARVER